MAKAETDSDREAREAQEELDGEDMGTAAKAHNGEPVNLDDERQRRGRPLDDEEDVGAGGGEESDGHLFVWEQGRKVTLGTLVDRRVPVEHAFVFGGKRIKGSGGLMALDEQPLLVMRGMSAGVNIVPTHDDEGKVTKVVIEQRVAAQFVKPAGCEEAIALLRPMLEEQGWRPPAVAA